MAQGQFTSIAFNPVQFNTGIEGKSTKALPDKDLLRPQILREDEEILLLLLAVGEEE